MECHGENRFQGRDPFLVGGHHRSHDQNVGDFADFRNLNIKGQEGEVDPASVTADGLTEGDQHSQNKGVDLETLMGEDSALANNSFAQMVRAEGEDAAEANVRNCVASINENGEIIRNFAA